MKDTYRFIKSNLHKLTVARLEMENLRLKRMNKGDVALTLLNAIGEARGRKELALGPRRYVILDEMSLFIYELFEGVLPYHYAFLAYKTWTDAKWIDLFLRNAEGYQKVSEVYFLRLGWHDDGSPVLPEETEKVIKAIKEAEAVERMFREVQG